MAWVYMLRGSCGRHYIGSTTDLDRRLAQHCNGHTHTTHRFGQPLELIASLAMDFLPDASQLEGEMKRKKNPRLALFLLDQKRKQLGG